ncbi:MAG: hypothetical protein V3R87_08535, partial [Dehalococcoidia bacterium]
FARGRVSGILAHLHFRHKDIRLSCPRHASARELHTGVLDSGSQGCVTCSQAATSKQRRSQRSYHLRFRNSDCLHTQLLLDIGYYTHILGRSTRDDQELLQSDVVKVLALQDSQTIACAHVA